MSKNTHIYIYNEPLKEFSQDRLLSCLTICETATYEQLFLRLIGGTLDIQHKNNGVRLKNRVNYLLLGTEEVQRLNYTYVNKLIPLDDEELAKKYFNLNRNNTNFFDRLLFETSNFFFREKCGDHISAFVHLYRLIEHISYSFPLIFASKSTNYMNTFDELQSFLTNGEKGELGFFKSFQKRIIDEDTLQLTFNISFDTSSDDIDSLIRLFNKIEKKNALSFESISADGVELKYTYLFGLIITLRNRYFHMASKSSNLMNTDIDMNILFALINKHAINWVGYLYNILLIHGIEKLVERIA